MTSIRFYLLDKILWSCGRYRGGVDALKMSTQDKFSISVHNAKYADTDPYFIVSYWKIAQVKASVIT